MMSSMVASSQFRSQLMMISRMTAGTSIRLLHISTPRRDADNTARFIGAGLCALGMGGAGIGIGIIFGNLMHGISQNPSTVAQLRPNAILGFAMCETMGLFSLALAGAILFAV